MNPQVYEYVLQGAAAPLVDIYAPVVALKSTALYFGAAGLTAALLVLVAYREGQGRPTPVAGTRPLWPASLMLFAMYVLTWCQIDEVSINLEHSYNLHHSGRFSFSPVRMVDGTVEYVYYLLLAPFASSAVTLIVANFSLGLLIAWAHLRLLFEFVKDARPSAQLGLLLLFAVNYPLIAVLSNGFGNTLVSLACLASLSLYFAGRTTFAAILASALPLLRPDAVLCSYALLFAFTATTGVTWSWRMLGRWVWPLAAVGAYLLVLRVAYGHWIPTPIAFKSVHPSMVTAEAIKNAVSDMLQVLSSPLSAAAAVAVLASFWLKSDIRLSVCRWLLLPMAGVLFFYSLTHNLIGDYSGDVYARYWIGFSLTLFLCGLFVLIRLAAALPASWQLRVFAFAVPAAVVFLTADAIGWEDSRTVWRNRTDLAYAGQIVATVVPDTLVLSTSELSTFGLMIDRDIVDLWGYTNPVIARSRLLNEARVRNDPSFFLSAKPDVYFVYLEPKDLSEIERTAANFHHVRKDANLLGEMSAVFASYDFVVVRHPQRSLLLIVRRDSIPELRRSLEAHSYTESAHRDLDLEAFMSIYNKRKLVQYRF